MARKVTAGHQSMRETEHAESSQFNITHDVVAVDEEGEKLYVTESYMQKHLIDPHVRFADDYSMVQDIEVDGQTVDHFELRER
jgi:hypothetical protein